MLKEELTYDITSLVELAKEHGYIKVVYTTPAKICMTKASLAFLTDNSVAI